MAAVGLLRGGRHFSYVPLLALASLVALAKLIVYARLVGVEAFGQLGRMLLVSAAFGFVGSLGLQTLASRDMPALFARHRGRRAVRLQVQVIGVTTAVAALCIALLGVAGAGRAGLSAPELSMAVLHGWSQALFLVVAYERRSRLQLMRYAADMAGRSITVLLAGAAVALLHGSALAVIAAETVLSIVLSALALVGVVRRAELPAAFVWRHALAGLSRLPWRASLLLLAAALILFASIHLDRWVAAESLGSAAFGAYSLAWIAISGGQAVQALLNSGVLPLLAQRRALRDDSNALRLTSAVSGVVLVAGALALWPACWLVERAIGRWMPSYAPAVPLLLPLAVAALLRVADFWCSLAIVRGREALLARAQGAALAVCVLAVAALAAAGVEPAPLHIAAIAVLAAALSFGASVLAAVGPCGIADGAARGSAPHDPAQATGGRYAGR